MRLGKRMDVAGFAIRGDTSKKGVSKFIEEIVKILKMHKTHKPVTYKYPVNNLGGVGYTKIQPITESFIAYDAWPDFEGAYLVICSCKTVNLRSVSQKIRALGHRIDAMNAFELNFRK